MSLPRLFWAPAVLGLIGLAGLPSPARSAEAKKAHAPALVVQFKSIDGLIADGKYLAQLTGKEDKATEVNQFIQGFAGSGIDTKRPIGAYGSFGDQPEDSSGAILIPVTDQSAFIDLLGRFNVKAEKGEGGLYTLTSEKLQMPLYLRFASKYAYVSNQERGLDKGKLLDPAKVLSAGRDNTIYAAFRLDEVPEGFKQLALQFIDTAVSQAQEKEQPGETPEQKALREVGAKKFGDVMTALVKEGGDLEIEFNVDRSAKELVGQVSLSGQASTKLSAGISKMSQARSVFAGLPTTDSALRLLVHVALPPDLRKAFEPVVDQGIQKSLANEKDEAKREHAEKFLKALEPSLKAGELDGAFTLRGPETGKHYTMVAGIKLKNGQDVEKALRDLVATAAERDREKVKLDAESAGDVKIHRVDAQKDFDAKGKQMFGDNPLYFAVKEDALLVGAGPQGLEALKEAISAKPGNSPQLQFEVSMSRLAPVMDQPGAAGVAADVFSKAGEGNDTVTFTVEGGKTLRARFVMKAPVVTFLSRLQEAAGNGPRKPRPAEKPVEEPTDR